MRGLRSERGAAAVEFALVLPILIVLVLGVVEFSWAFQTQTTLAAAAREGARELALGNEADVVTAVQAASTSLDPAIAPEDIAVSPASCDGAVAGTDATVSITYSLPYLTGFFGESITLDADGVMRCNG